MPLQYSDYNCENYSHKNNVENNIGNNNNNNINCKRRNRTLKRKEIMNGTSKVELMKNMINREGFTEVNSCPDDEEDESLANYQPLCPPTSVSMENKDCKAQATNQNAQQPTQPAQQPAQQQPSTANCDEAMEVEGFNGMREGYSEQYMNQFVPYYQNAANAPNSNNNSELTEKLNYLIHLVEEQKDEKTGHVTEELILYSFLGVFVIYIVDSFARVGKYVR